MRLWKWQALGNDYLLVERADLPEPLSPEGVRRLCDYHYGVGSDGLLEIVAHDGSSADLRVWNPDGSVAEVSSDLFALDALVLAGFAWLGAFSSVVSRR